VGKNPHYPDWMSDEAMQQAPRKMLRGYWVAVTVGMAVAATLFLAAVAAGGVLRMILIGN
jgi:hypothetical protein